MPYQILKDKLAAAIAAYKKTALWKATHADAADFFLEAISDGERYASNFPLNQQDIFKTFLLVNYTNSFRLYLTNPARDSKKLVKSLDILAGEYHQAFAAYTIHDYTLSKRSENAFSSLNKTSFADLGKAAAEAFEKSSCYIEQAPSMRRV